MEVQRNHDYPKETDALIANGRRSNGSPRASMSLDDHALQDRLGFIRKVYVILSVQLTVTFGAILFTKSNDSVDKWMKGQAALALSLFFVSFFVQCAIMCCRSVARKVPTNYILLSIFTLCQSFFFSWVVAQYTASTTIMAAGMTLGMTVALTVYAMFTKTDFTVCGALFFIMSIGLLMLFVFSIFMSFVSWWHPFVSAVLVCVYGLYLVLDTQMIAGGRSHQISMDDYVIGALLLYIDITMIFFELLKLLGDKH